MFVHPCVTGGQWKPFDLEAETDAFLDVELEAACTWRVPLVVPAHSTSTGKTTSQLDKQVQLALHLPVLANS